MLHILRSSQEKNITNIIIIIIMVVILCHTPDRVLTVFKAIQQPENKHCPDPLIYASHFCNLLIVVNSSANFVIYCIFRRRFRRILCSLLCRRCTGAGYDWRHDSSVCPTSPERTSLRSLPGSLPHPWSRRSTPHEHDHNRGGVNGKKSDSRGKQRTSDAEHRRKLSDDTSLSDPKDTVTFHVGP